MQTANVTCFVLLLAISFPALILYLILTSNARYFTVTKCALGGIYYLFVLLWIVKPYFTSPLRYLSGPPNPRFAFGHGPYLFSSRVAPRLLSWMREVPNNGFIFVRGFFHISQILIVTTPETIVEVLNTHAYDYQKPSPARKFLARVLGNGLVVNEGQEHKVQRKAVAAAFQGKHIRELVPVFWAKACHLVNNIAADLPTSANGAADAKSTYEQGGRSGTVEIGPYASRCTLDIIGKAGFNRDFNTLDNSDDELARQYETIMNPDKGQLLVYFAVNMLLPMWIVRRIPWRRNQRITEATITLRRISRQMVADRKAEVAREKEDAAASSSVDILSVLMRSSAMSDDKLVDECLTFLAAGHETTSSAITWASYLLSTHSAAQDRLRAELQARLPAPHEAVGTQGVTAADIDALPFLHGVCNETLRIYPTVPVTARVAQRDTMIQGQAVPRGTEVLISPWAINRLETLWGADAEDFKPERWVDGEGACGDRAAAAALGGAKSHYAFMTFLHGPRSCIGQGFARLEMKCLLAALVLRFRLELRDPKEVPIPAGAITIKPKGGLWLRLTAL